MARLAAHNLHVPLAQVTVHVGNTTLPVGPLASHSRTTASVLSAVRADGPHPYQPAYPPGYC